MRYEIEINDAIDAAHQLHLPYDSPCNRLHGHRYNIRVKIGTERLDKNGMVIDFTVLKTVIRRYDHQNLNQFFQPTTAENFSAFLASELQAAMTLSPYAEEVPVILSVAVSETPNTWAVYHASA